MSCILRAMSALCELFQGTVDLEKAASSNTGGQAIGRGTALVEQTHLSLYCRCELRSTDVKTSCLKPHRRLTSLFTVTCRELLTSLGFVAACTKKTTTYKECSVVTLAFCMYWTCDVKGAGLVRIMESLRVAKPSSTAEV